MNGSKEYFVDANIFLRVFVREDEPSFLACSELLRRIQRGDMRAIINTLVFAEVNWVLGKFYRFSKPDVVMALHSIIGLNNLAMDDRHDISRGLALYQKHNVTFIDALIASHDAIAITKAPIVSYDKDFDKLGIKRVTPSELIKTK